jgi:hypothetical protein
MGASALDINALNVSWLIVFSLKALPIFLTATGLLGMALNTGTLLAGSDEPYA